jgi:ribonuclease VapC
VVLDTSAILVILFDEPERRHFNELIEADGVRIISAATFLEAALAVESRRGEAAGRELDLFLHRAQITVVPVDSEQAEVARVAWRKYGKGRHRAGLNFGDCFSYALTKVSGEPLLAKGGDFAQTDIERCPVICSPNVSGSTGV